MAIFIPRWERHTNEKFTGNAQLDRDFSGFLFESFTEDSGYSEITNTSGVTLADGVLSTTGTGVYPVVDDDRFFVGSGDFTLVIKFRHTNNWNYIVNFPRSSRSLFVVNTTLRWSPVLNVTNIAVNNWHTLALTRSGNKFSASLNGTRFVTDLVNTWTDDLGGNEIEFFNGAGNSGYIKPCDIEFIAVARQFSSDIDELSANPYQLLKPRQIWFPVTSGAGGGVNLTPTQASFGLSGQTPTLLAGYSEAPTQGSFTFTGLTPSLGIGNAVNLTPTQATFTFTGLTPIESIGYTDTAIQGSSTFTGLNSSLSSGFVESPIQLSTLWSGQTPTIDSGVSLQAAQGTYNFSGLTPSLLSGYVDTATQATFLFVGGTPSANIGGGINLTPAQGSFAFTGLNPAPNFGQVHTPIPASFNFTGLVPSLQAGDAVNLTPAQGSFTFTGLTSTIALGFSNTPTQATFLWSGLVPSTNLVPSEITLSQASIDAIADAVWQKAIETYTAEEMMRVFMSALSGKREGLGTATERYMSVDGGKPRITLTADQNGNGTPIIDGSA